MGPGTVVELPSSRHGGRPLRLAVDDWRSAAVDAYFLTHMHGDHLGGLSDTWSRGRIYCTNGTAELLLHRWPALAPLVVRLQLWEPAAMVLGAEGASLTVTSLDAVHCVGAAMFLFQGSFGNVLHTGDFRWELSMQKALFARPALRSAVPLEALYVDNTYCHPSHAFPPRAEVLQTILDIIQRHPAHSVLICLDTLGKEEILAAVALATGEAVGVLEHNNKPLAVLRQWPAALFTSDWAAARLKCGAKWQASPEYIERMNRVRPTIAIVPSARCSDSDAKLAHALAPVREPNTAAPGSGKQLVFRVPYSLHNNYEELQAFIEHLQPRRVVPMLAKNGWDPRQFLPEKENLAESAAQVEPMPPQLGKYVAPQRLLAARPLSQRPLLRVDGTTECGSSSPQAAPREAAPCAGSPDGGPDGGLGGSLARVLCVHLLCVHAQWRLLHDLLLALLPPPALLQPAAAPALNRKRKAAVSWQGIAAELMSGVQQRLAAREAARRRLQLSVPVGTAQERPAAPQTY